MYRFYIIMKIEILMFYVYIPLCFTLTGENICRRNITQGENLAMVIGCCKDYEEKNDHCVECSPGFIGLNCTQTCPENYYGMFCKNKCKCDEMQTCHRVCGCVQLSDLDNSSMINKSTLPMDMTSSYFRETCPIITYQTSTSSVASTTPGVTPLKQGTTSNEILFSKPYLIGAASVTGAFIVTGIGLIFRLYFGRKKEECLDHHNALYVMEEDQQITENAAVHEEQAEHLYDTCTYEEACYSTLTLRVNNESRQNPITSTELDCTDENVYEFSDYYEGQNFD